MTSSPRLLGALLLSRGALTKADLDGALRLQRASGERLGEVLIQTGRADEATVWQALSQQLSLPFLPPPLEPAGDALPALPAEFARRVRALPIRIRGREIQVVLGDPVDLEVVDEIQFRTGRRVRVAVTTPSALADGLRSAYAGEATASAPTQVEAFLRRAVDGRASDVHIEATGEGVRIRERVDGVLQNAARLPAGSGPPLISRIKVMAGMDISVRRRPQDGGFPFRHAGRRLSVRVSTLPVEDGEKAVLRILDPGSIPQGLGRLGLPEESLARFRNLVRAGHGVILATGPTGSGKSTTLLGALAELDREGLNVVTLEDPIEYRIAGVNQVQVNPRAGLSFPAGLRATLRQDPDVIMVGEIRDRETAEIAMSAAMTGHLVLSTLHTTDAPGALTRLLQMGVPPHLVAGGLSGVVAQRLLRRSCSRCGGRGKGCRHCRDGYRGRVGVFQLLVVDDPLREVVMEGAEPARLRRIAERAGMTSLAQEARRKVSEGLTTPHEVGRILHRDPGASRTCPRCSAAVPSEARGCPGCGQELDRRCRCGVRLREEWRYCPDCLRSASGP